MAVITMPAGLAIAAGSGMGQLRFDLSAESDATGAGQSRVLAPPRWTLQLVQPSALPVADADVWRSLVLRLRGRVNRLAAWDPGRPYPRGTARGTITLSAGASIGATTLALTGATVPGGGTPTLAAGDWLQVGTGLSTSQLVCITVDATLTGGAGTVQIEPPLRMGFSGGAAVRWDKPLAYYRARTESSSWVYGPQGATVSGFALDLIEAFA